MTSNEDLNEVVAGFREAEGSLRALAKDAEKLQTAAEVLGATDSAVQASAAQLTAAAGKLTNASVQLGTLAAQLNATTEALIKADPEGVKRELTRNVDQVERLRSHLDETAGESRSNFETINKSLTQIKVLAAAAAALALAAAGLVLALN